MPPHETRTHYGGSLHLALGTAAPGGPAGGPPQTTSTHKDANDSQCGRVVKNGLQAFEGNHRKGVKGEPNPWERELF